MPRNLVFLLWMLGFPLIAPRLGGWLNPDYYLRYGADAIAMTIFTGFAVTLALAVWLIVGSLLYEKKP